uniref:Probable RNA-binding protein 19 n=1 Tax=Phallusia mammillata TaxID=59560 RepID=A0A6F9DQS7_9ASCI|nr:probable RNA-binding protein 19 [Phallusia mammillata]
MSRLIIKDLPEKLNIKNFQREVSSYGTVTDFQMIHTKDGTFRRFGFVGYKSKEDTDKALHNLNKKMILNQKIKAEICNSLVKSSKKHANTTAVDGALLGKNNSADLTFLHSKMQQPKNDKAKQLSGLNVSYDEDRLFVTNLSSSCTVDDLQLLFASYDSKVQINIPLNTRKQCIGYGFAMFSKPSYCKQACLNLDGSIFQGRQLHITPAKSKEIDNKNITEKKKPVSEKTPNNKFNTLFIGTNSIANVIAERVKCDKTFLVDGAGNKTAAVGVALGEAQIVKETKEFLETNGVSIGSFNDNHSERSKTVIIAKNLPLSVTSSELHEMFEKHAKLGRVLLAPSGVAAIIECLDASAAKKAFMKLAYRRIHHKPLYLEWAPVSIFDNKISSEPLNNNKIFVKNLNFKTNEKNLKSHFETVGEVVSCSVAKKKRAVTGELLSMGYGFVEYKLSKDCTAALTSLNNSKLDGHMMKLEPAQDKHTAPAKSSESSKLIVRNIPFQANDKEIEHLFKSFGELRSVRLPRKIKSGDDRDLHRGFAFVDFMSVENALNAFNALKDSTHLYGRRLVLEWATT